LVICNSDTLVCVRNDEMIKRFEGESGRRTLIETLREQKIVAGNDPGEAAVHPSDEGGPRALFHVRRSEKPKWLLSPRRASSALKFKNNDGARLRRCDFAA
jgi:hypothetical protein